MMDDKERTSQPYFCRFRILGGGTLIVPYRRITKITVDKESCLSKVYLADEKVPVTVTNSPDEINSLTNQTDR